MVSIIIQFNIHPVLKTILFATQLSQNSHLRNSCTFKRNSETKNMASVPITSWQIDGQTVETVADFIFLAPKSLQMVIATMRLKDTYSLEGKL